MVSGLTFQRETFLDAWMGIEPLIDAHWREVAYPGSDPPAIDVEAYSQADADGRLAVYTARLGGSVIGYALFWIGPIPQQHGRIGAWQEAVYVSPDNRAGGAGLQLLQWCDANLAAAGVHLVHHSVRPGRDFSPVLRMLGYRPIETVYVRQLHPEPPRTT